MWSTNGDVSSSGAPEETSYTYDQHGNETSETNPLGETTTTWSTSLDEPSCDGAALATTNCSSSLQGPVPVTPGGTITPPSTAPPEGVTYTLYDTYGNALYTTTGVYCQRSSNPAVFLSAVQVIQHPDVQVIPHFRGRGSTTWAP